MNGLGVSFWLMTLYCFIGLRVVIFDELIWSIEDTGLRVAAGLIALWVWPGWVVYRYFKR